MNTDTRLTEEDVEVVKTAAMVLSGFNRGELNEKLSQVIRKMEANIWVHSS